LTAAENVALPLVLAGVPLRERRQRVHDTMDRFGLLNRAAHRPDQLSGGQRQRVAIARATIMWPTVILADEPTGNLDRHNAEQVYELMLQLNQEFGTSFLVATHDPLIAGRMDRVVQLEDGRLID
jgi:ABC-type lipoprotein export system ATPase subunit